MDIETFRELCLTVTGSTESTPFIDTSVVVFKVAGKMFAYVDLECGAEGFCAAMKCVPDLSLHLRERYAGVTATAHKTELWNLVRLESDVPNVLIAELISHAAAEVIRALPRKKREEYLAAVGATAD